MPMSLVDCVEVVVVWIQLGRSRFALASFAWFTSRALACLYYGHDAISSLLHLFAVALAQGSL